VLPAHDHDSTTIIDTRPLVFETTQMALGHLEDKEDPKAALSFEVPG
jgi:hypothetical protein